MSKASIRIRLYDDHNCLRGEYLKVEEILGCLRCKRLDNLYDLYSLDGEYKIFEAATKIYWENDGHLVAEYFNGAEHHIWR